MYLDLPLLTGAEAPHAPHVAMTAAAWPGLVALLSSETDAGYAPAATVAAPSVVGTTLTPLAAAPAGLWDRGPSLRVRLVAGALASVGEDRVLAGAAQRLADQERLACRFVAGNAFTLREPADIVISTGVLHHFRRDDLAAVFAQHERSAAICFVHVDVRPSLVAPLGSWVFHQARMRERLARFDGVRQGLAVWLIGLLVVIVLAVLGAVLGAQYNVLSQLNLPSIPVSGDTATTAGITAGIAALLASLVGALLGGKLGTRYHRKIDRVGFGA